MHHSKSVHNMPSKIKTKISVKKTLILAVLGMFSKDCYYKQIYSILQSGFSKVIRSQHRNVYVCII